MEDQGPEVVEGEGEVECEDQGEGEGEEEECLEEDDYADVAEHDDDCLDDKELGQKLGALKAANSPSLPQDQGLPEPKPASLPEPCPESKPTWIDEPSLAEQARAERMARIAVLRPLATS